MSRGLQGRVDVAQFRALAGKSSQLDPKLKRALRKRLKDAAGPAVQDVKTTVLSAPASGGASGEHTGLRQGLADGVKVTLMTGKNAGIQIRNTGSGLPASQKKLVRAYNKPGGWRHPVFKTGAWVKQLGRQFFEARIVTHQAEFTEAARAAMKDALDTLK